MRPLLLSLVALPALIWAAGPASAAQGTTTTALPLRAAPASNTELLLTMPAGASVTVGACSGGWCRVTWNTYSGYAPRSGLVITAVTRTRGPVRGGVTTADGSEIWPILPPYPYRSGYYPKADWYHDIPPYVSIEPSFYRRRYFMIAQEHDRYRYMPTIFRGDRYRGGSIANVNLGKVSAGVHLDESMDTYTMPTTATPKLTTPAPITPQSATPPPAGTNKNSE